MVENTENFDVNPEYVIASVSVDIGETTHSLLLVKRKANWFGLRKIYEKWSEKL